MRKGHKQLFGDKLWGKKFWSAGYFHRTVGAVNAETVKRYIQEGQKKHWEEQLRNEQKTLFHFSA
jgi:REP element-mobilizing transposase RayT